MHSLRRATILNNARMSKRAMTSSASRKNEIKHAIDTSVGPMLAYQKGIPNLPIPTVESSALKYMETIRPHLDAKGNKAARLVIDEFVHSPYVQTLQKRLEERAAQPGMKNWLSEWWNDVAYMSPRDPVVVFVSYFYLHVLGLGEAWKEGDKASKKAALMLKALLAFRELVETQQLAPDKIKDTPLCMESYKWIFNSSRYPQKGKDTAHKFPPESNNHIVFIRNNRFFEVETQSANGQISIEELEAQIDKIYALAASFNGPAVGVLSSENRDTWADARNALVASPLNAESLKRIESAIIVVPLDSTTPTTREEGSWTMWTGDGRNRFYDKQQLIVCDNGVTGWMGEHSCMDGTTTLRLNEFMCYAVASGKVSSSSTPSTNLITTPKELKFELDSTSTAFIAQAKKNFDQLIGDHELAVLHYSKNGGKHIKSHKMSPDAFAQMVKQLAFHKLYGRPGVCYESAQTRKFQLGRTEVIRSASEESRQWVDVMVNKNSSHSRYIYFRDAIRRHTQYASWAAAAHGCDRHLFGLKKMIKEGEEERMPKLYTNPAFAMTNHWELSTSQLSSPYFEGWGYGEVVPDGYGLSYSIGDNYIRWTITCLKTNTQNRMGQPWHGAERLKQALEEAADETFKMLEEGAAYNAKL